MAVVPLAGTWIETVLTAGISYFGTVAPLAGAWIETGTLKQVAELAKSLPSWERGLKRTWRG